MITVRCGTCRHDVSLPGGGLVAVFQGSVSRSGEMST
jgi:hypothetical protein